MDEARIRPDEFGEMGQEGDDVMLGDALDFVDAVHVEGDVAGLGPDVFRALLGDHADFGEGVAGVGLDLEPDLEPRLRLPDGDHFGTGIARDHGELFSLGNSFFVTLPPKRRRRRRKALIGAKAKGRIAVTAAGLSEATRSMQFSAKKFLDGDSVFLIEAWHRADAPWIGDLHGYSILFPACKSRPLISR